MKLYESEKYLEDLKGICEIPLPWDKLQQNSVLISGANGMVGSCLIDVIMYRNYQYGMNCMVYALGRNELKIKDRFSYCWEDRNFQFISQDINDPIIRSDIKNVDFVLHLASNTHPIAYATDPIGTITTNIIGLKNMLDFAVDHHTKCMAFASSNEIYGENRGDVEIFDEGYCGYINCNILRAGYPESKRCGEALCQAFIKQRGLYVVIPRLTRSYGPTMLKSDTKAISQFILKAIAGEDIVLKSTGNQYYSYTYVADAVSGLLTVLLCGECGESYNIADSCSDIMLKDLAEIIAEKAGTKVIFETPDYLEQIGYSKATKARLSGQKINQLGWHARYKIGDGVGRTIDILKNL